MSFAPYAAIWVLLVAAAGIALFAVRRPQLAMAASVTVSFLTLILWYLFRPEAAAPSLSFAGRQWAIGDAAWHLTGTVLLVSLTAILLAAVGTGHPRLSLPYALALGLPAAVLPVVWAADDRTRVMGVALFAAAWMFSQLPGNEPASNTPRFDWRSGGLLLAALFPLWAAYTVPGGRVFLSAIAAVLLIASGVAATSHTRGPTLQLLPAVAAASVLIGALGVGSPSMLGVVAGTIAGLLALLLGLAWAWEHPTALPRALALGLGGVLLVAAVWAGQSALLAATRLAVFAPVLVGLASAGRPPGTSGAPVPAAAADGMRRQLSPLLLGLLVAFLAIAGLPLTVGFSTLAPIYDSWSGPAGWVLLLVTVALLTMWLATLYQVGRTTARAATVDRAVWIRSLALIPPAVGLIALEFGGLAGSWVTWAAIAVPAAAGIVLGHFAPDMGGLGGLLREAAALPQPLAAIGTRMRQARKWVAGALGDALAILEGENGLIWLLGLLLLIIWIT